MNPSEIVQGIKEYTGDYEINLGDLYIAQNVVEDVVGFFLGLVAYLVVVGMGIVTTFDIAYITIPVFQEKYRGANWKGDLSDRKIKLISNDALLAVHNSSLDTVEKSPLVIYLKKRLKSYIICAVILYISIAGTNTISGIVANIVGIILGAFGV